MASGDGIRFLSTEDLLLKQLTKSFAQLDPVSIPKILSCLLTKMRLKFNGTPPKDPIFSEDRFSGTLTYGYLEMIGTLSAYKEGVECGSLIIGPYWHIDLSVFRLMEQFKIFTALYHICELRSREDLVKGIIQSLDYNL